MRLGGEDAWKEGIVSEGEEEVCFGEYVEWVLSAYRGQIRRMERLGFEMDVNIDCDTVEWFRNGDDGYYVVVTPPTSVCGPWTARLESPGYDSAEASAPMPCSALRKCRANWRESLGRIDKSLFCAERDDYGEEEDDA